MILIRLINCKMSIEHDGKSMDIGLFRWVEFPLEKDKFTVCIVYDGNIKDHDKLISYIKTIFPENPKKCIDTKDIIDYNVSTKSKKTTLIIDDKNTSFNKSDWVDSLLINNETKSFNIIIGKYETISKTSLTMADVIFFETYETLNKYKSDRFGFTILFSQVLKNSCKDLYFIVDKQNMNDIVGYFPKIELMRY